jgi:hypothetical protein
VLGATGFGAVNEVAKYVLTLTLSATNVGGYDNTARDLVANLAGGVLIAIWMARHRQRTMTSRSAPRPPDDRSVGTGSTKRNGGPVVADELSFDVPAGQVVGFLGPKGRHPARAPGSGHRHRRDRHHPRSAPARPPRPSLVGRIEDSLAGAALVP